MLYSRGMGSNGILLTIASNPPLGTTGERTRARVALAARVLDCPEVRMANLFALPTYRTDGLSVLGATGDVG